MNMTIPISRAALAAMLLVFLVGCASYATLVRSDGNRDGLSIQALEKTWQEYNVYFTRTGGAFHGNVALLFDPGKDNQTLIVRRWERIEDQQTLSDIITSMRGYGPELYLVKGPNGVLFGYLYGAKQWLIAKAVNDTTMHVYDFLPRPSGPGF